MASSNPNKGGGLSARSLRFYAVPGSTARTLEDVLKDAAVSNEIYEALSGATTLYFYNDFSSYRNGTRLIDNEVLSAGSMQLSWNDGAPVNPAAVHYSMIEDGVVRHQGTTLVAACAVALAGTPLEGSDNLTISTAFVEPTDRDGDLVLYASPPDEYASTRLSMINGASSNGYVAYIYEDGPNSNHFFRIVRDTSSIPQAVATVDAGRRLNEGEIWSFARRKNTYHVLMNGKSVLKYEATGGSDWDYSIIDAAGYVLNSNGRRLPAIPWISFTSNTATDASLIPFTPTTPGDWNTSPETIGEALDELASRLP